MDKRSSHWLNGTEGVFLVRKSVVRKKRKVPQPKTGMEELFPYDHMHANFPRDNLRGHDTSGKRPFISP